MSDFEMAKISAGSVTLHDARRKIHRTVELEAFEIGVYAATEEQFAEILGIAAEHPRRPARDLSWLRAVRFCNAASEWEGLYPAYSFNGAWSIRASVRRGGAPRMHHEDVGLRLARGGFGSVDAAQGWSAVVDRERAAAEGALPVGWTPRTR